MKNMRSFVLFFCTLGLIGSVPVFGQKKISELTLAYEFSIIQGGKPDAGNFMHTVYIKGSKSRSETVNSLFSSSVLYDNNTGLGVILQEVSGQKVLIRLSSDNWQERSKLYEGVVFKNTSETKEIAGYKCIKATAQTPTGVALSVYYTRDVVPDNKDYDAFFKNLDGLALEYELTKGDVTIRYKILKINFNPVPASKFDIPASGYREMNYEEGKKAGVVNN